ncbi:MAG: hypothetical protein ACLRFE_00530 [Clostridia bacterium]
MKLGVKKLIIGVLVAVSAIACFATLGVALNNSKVDNQEQYLDIGIEYKDGWYLIDSAEDYYTMCSYTNVGANPGAKYKLVNDITIDPRKASMDNFIGATLNGNGYSIATEYDPNYEPPTQTGLAPSSTADYISDSGYASESGIWFRWGAYHTNFELKENYNRTYWHEQIYGISVANRTNAIFETGTNNSGNVEDVSENAIQGKKVTIVDDYYFNPYEEPGYPSRIADLHYGMAIGGLFGVIKNAEVKDIYLTISAEIEFYEAHGRSDPGSEYCDHSWSTMGGLAGMTYNSTLSRCVVEYAPGGDLKYWTHKDRIFFNGYRTYHGSLGSFVGYAHETEFDQCLVMIQESDRKRGQREYNGNFAQCDEWQYLVGNIHNDWELDGVIESWVQNSTGAFTGTFGDDRVYIPDDDHYGTSYLPEGFRNDYDWIMYTTHNITENGDSVYYKPIQTCFVKGNEYTITVYGLKKNYEDITKFTVSKGGTYADAGLPPNPTRTGQFFDHYREESTWTRIELTDKVPGDVTLYAMYTPDWYTVKAYINDNDGDTNNKATVLYNVNNDCIYNGGAASPWSLSLSDGYIYTSWYEYGHVLNDGLINMENYIIRPGYTLKGWFNGPDSDAYQYDIVKYKVRDDMDVYAQWEPITYQINISIPTGFEGVITGLPTSFNVRTSIKLPNPVPGYTIVYTINGNDYSPGATISAGTIPPGNLEIKVNIELLSYKITLDLSEAKTTNDNTITEAYRSNIKVGKSSKFTITGSGNKYEIVYSVIDGFSLPENKHVCIGGYQFVSWQLQSGGASTIKWTPASGTSKTAVQSGSYGNATLKAELDEVESVITLNLNESAEDKITPSIKNYSPNNSTYNSSTKTITYKPSSGFDFPKSSEISAPGYKFVGWTLQGTLYPNGNDNVTTLNGSPVKFKHNFAGVNIGSFGNFTMSANWEIANYEIRLSLTNGGTLDTVIRNTDINKDGKKYSLLSTGPLPTLEFSDVGGDGNREYWIIKYNIKSEFSLPIDGEANRYGYTLTNWKSPETLDSDAGNWGSNTNFTAGLKIGTEGARYYGNITLEAVWQINKYKVKLDASGGMIQGEPYYVFSDIYYISPVVLQSAYNPTRDGYEFVGWASENGRNSTNGEINENEFSDGVYRYEYIKENNKEGEIEGVLNWTQETHNWDTQIFKAISTVSKLMHGDLNGTATFNVYAIWLPVYTLTIQSNIGDKTKDANDISGIYIDGEKNPDTDYINNNKIMTIKNHYFMTNPNLLYNPLAIDVFNTPTDNRTGYNFALFNYGKYISGWQIKVNGKFYYTSKLSGEDVSWGDWEGPLTQEELNSKSPNDKVASGIDMRRLQGNITATPIWETIRFDVVFKIKDSQGYKREYLNIDADGDEIKDNTDQITTNSILFGQQYVIYQGGLPTLNTETKAIQSKDISGYSIIYFHTYDKNGRLQDRGSITRTNGDAISINNIISGNAEILNSTWDYVLGYKQYAGDKPEGASDWYIEIEGYYAPNLYRLQIDLGLEGSVDNTFILVNNDFANVGTVPSEEVLSAKVLQGEEYQAVVGYGAYQHKVYVSEGEYYIYLLQDQIIENGYIYNRYDDGKNIINPTANGKPKWELPTFTTDYYEMQYYYTLNNSSKINTYQLNSDLEQYYINYAMEKLGRINDGTGLSINNSKDWKYEYCDDTIENIKDMNGVTRDFESFSLHVYWYRNILNVELENVLKDCAGDTQHGYILVRETEQVYKPGGTATLLDHNRYHVVIYDGSKYVIYSFDGFGALGDTDWYSIDRILNHDDWTTEAAVARDAGGYEIQKSYASVNGNIVFKTEVPVGDAPTIPIYFGNLLTFRAVDQSLDTSYDNLIGYRFEGYSYDITSNAPTTPTNTQVDANTIDKKQDDNETAIGNRYEVDINLQNYEEGKSAKYFVDRDILHITSQFDSIKYIAKYQVVDTNGDVVSDYGTIELRYPGRNNQYGSIVQYEELIVGDNTITATMLVSLGSEITKWTLNGNEATSNTDEGNYFKLANYGLDTNGQITYLKICVDSLRYIKYAGQTRFSASATQEFGTVNAVCQYIGFDIEVKLHDVSGAKEDSIDTIDGANDYSVFTITGDVNNYKVRLKNGEPNAYILTMNTTAGDGKSYYTYDGTKYVVSRIYLGNNSKHSTTELVKYLPTYSDAIPLNLVRNYTLGYQSLQYSVNYVDNYEVVFANRKLVIVVDLAPVQTLTLNVSNNPVDIYKENRAIDLNGQTIATATEGNALQLQENPLKYESGAYIYESYYSEELKLKFTGNSNYYSSAKLTGTASDLNIATNNEITYRVDGVRTITIELQPRVYTLTVLARYKDDGELMNWVDVLNPSDEQIISSLSVTWANGNLLTNTDFYYGDKLLLTYVLSTPDAYIVDVSKNGGIFYPNVQGYEFEIQSNTEIIVTVYPVSEKINLATNLRSNKIGNIWYAIDANVLDDNIDLNSLTALDLTKRNEVGLVDGNKLVVYMTETAGYEFANTYTYNSNGNSTEITYYEKTSADGQNLKVIELISNFELTQNGLYTLNFNPVEIQVVFEYYDLTLNSLITDMSTEQECKIDYVKPVDAIGDMLQEGSVVTLIRGTERNIYDFEKYTYKGLDISESFTLTQEMVDEMDEGRTYGDEMVLTIRANYIHQYKVEWDAIDVVLKVLRGEDLINNGEYYRAETEIFVEVQTLDTDHYKLTSNINDEDVTESTTGISNVSKTTYDNMSQYSLTIQLTEDLDMEFKSEAEEYVAEVVEEIDGVAGAGKLITGSLNTHNITYAVEHSEHKYGTTVTIEISLAKPTGSNGQCYVLTGATFEGTALTITRTESAENNIYVITYTITGDIENTPELRLIYVPWKQVSMVKG